jgi:hypothetical protein
MESIDDLLAQVKAEYQEQEQGKQPKKQPLFQKKNSSHPPPPVPPSFQPNLSDKAGHPQLMIAY